MSEYFCASCAAPLGDDSYMEQHGLPLCPSCGRRVQRVQRVTLPTIDPRRQMIEDDRQVGPVRARQSRPL